MLEAAAIDRSMASFKKKAEPSRSPATATGMQSFQLYYDRC
jgi:hypothetical protein